MSVDEANADERFAESAEPYRRELMAHCYRMLGSLHDAEDLVQETYLRAWRGYEDFEGRSSLRTWLYRIATHACLNALDRADRRVLPSGIGAPSDDPTAELAPERNEISWLEPVPDTMIGLDAVDPAAIVGQRESTRLAFVAALQYLPARQRAVLLLRDVLRWKASEVAALLDMSVAAVNSALQRAHAQLSEVTPSSDVAAAAEVDRHVVERYVEAFVNADMSALALLLRDDVRLEMPPIPDWFDGRDSVLAFLTYRVVGAGRRRALVTAANGQFAVASYVPDADDVFRRHIIQVLTIDGGLITRFDAFFDSSLFDSFDLPDTYPTRVDAR